jgi:hypothetical protein
LARVHEAWVLRWKSKAAKARMDLGIPQYTQRFDE